MGVLSLSGWVQSDGLRLHPQKSFSFSLSPLFSSSKCKYFFSIVQHCLTLSYSFITRLSVGLFHCFDLHLDPRVITECTPGAHNHNVLMTLTKRPKNLEHCQQTLVNQNKETGGCWHLPPPTRFTLKFRLTARCALGQSHQPRNAVQHVAL